MTVVLLVSYILQISAPWKNPKLKQMPRTQEKHPYLLQLKSWDQNHTQHLLQLKGKEKTQKYMKKDLLFLGPRTARTDPNAAL